ncbi:MAG: hypothetical protein OEZ54_04340 [Gemmatimonadota bacterium]|nr:hypothetical protein [Gemmatimonadota bacterium]
MKALPWGFGITAIVAAVWWKIWGTDVVLSAVFFGLLATGLQVAANVVFERAKKETTAEFMKAYGVGMGLRISGVVVFAVLVFLDRELFPPLPSAFAYLGVLIPLLFMEMKYIK